MLMWLCQKYSTQPSESFHTLQVSNDILSIIAICSDEWGEILMKQFCEYMGVCEKMGGGGGVVVC